MNTRLSKFASILALIIGAMAVFSGGKALFVQDPDYNVIDWLLIYNFSIGIISAFVTAVLLWRNSKYALPATLTTFVMHSAVMLILITGFREVVASESIRAMTIRITTWSIILALVLLQSRLKSGLVGRKV